MLPLPISLAVGHLPILLAAAWIFWRWRLRVSKPLPGWRWLLFLAADAILFLGSVLLGVLLGGATGHFGFLAMRLGAQALFGEAPLLLAGLSALHLSQPKDGVGASRIRGAGLAALTLLLLAVYVEAYHHGPYDLQVRRHHVRLGAEDHGSLRLLHLTDLQTHAIRSYERGVFAQAAALKPDLIVFTGDYVQSRYRPTRRQATADLRRLLRETRLAPKYGFFAVQGDCEDDDWKSIFEGLDVTCLSNESRVIRLPGRRTLVLTGLDLRTSRFAEASVVRKALAAAPKGDRRIVIGHAPDFVAKLPQPSRIDLALAGHTHGGQIVIPGFGPPITFSQLPRRYAGGLNRYRDTPLHVSRGIGMERGSAPQVRFLCPPEICLINVRY